MSVERQRIANSLTNAQRITYRAVKDVKVFLAKGRNITYCRALVAVGLIQPKGKKNEFVLNGPYVKPGIRKRKSRQKSLAEKVEDIVQPVPVVDIILPYRRPSPDHTNASREDHVRRILSLPVQGEKRVQKVKCLTEIQMDYILNNWEGKTAKSIAEHLKAELFAVKLFCNLNLLETRVEKEKHWPNKPKSTEQYI
jgi:hypothetical protein